MITVYVPLLICVIGGLVFWFSDHPKASQIGLHCFWVGLLAYLLRGNVGL